MSNDVEIDVYKCKKIILFTLLTAIIVIDVLKSSYGQYILTD